MSSDFQAALSRVEELVLALDTEVDRIAKQFAEFLPATQHSLQGFLAGRVAQLSAENRAANADDIRAQATAIRAEVTETIERGMAAVLAKRQEIVGLGELEHTLRGFAEKAAAGVLREFAAKHREELSSTIHKELAALPLASTPGDPSAPLSPATYSIVDQFRGQWKSELDLKRGNFVTSRGSVYLVLRDCRGVLPTKQNQQGPDAYYALFTPCGAPGPKGSDGAGGNVVGPATSTDNAIARYDGTTGKLIQDSSATVKDDGTIIAPKFVLGSETTSGVFIKNNGGDLQAREGDDSAFVNFYAQAIIGSVSVNGAYLVNGVDSKSGAGAISVTKGTTRLTTTAANALTLADGEDGQIKRIVMVVDGGDGTLTPTTKTGFTTITFTAVGNAVTLQFFTTLGWMVISNYGCTIA